MFLTSFLYFVLEACFLFDPHADKHIFIPRIFTALPFHFTRRQFPVRLAFAITINKFQGQSVKYVGSDIRVTVSSHMTIFVILRQFQNFETFCLQFQQLF